jgi:hypothetical protein
MSSDNGVRVVIDLFELLFKRLRVSEELKDENEYKKSSDFFHNLIG